MVGDFIICLLAFFNIFISFFIIFLLKKTEGSRKGSRRGSKKGSKRGVQKGGSTFCLHPISNNLHLLQFISIVDISY